MMKIEHNLSRFHTAMGAPSVFLPALHIYRLHRFSVVLCSRGRSRYHGKVASKLQASLTTTGIKDYSCKDLLVKKKITHCHSIKVDRLRTWEHKFRYCLETTFVQRSCTISNSFAAFQMFANRRMRLPTLEFLISTVRCQLLTLQSIYW